MPRAERIELSGSERLGHGRPPSRPSRRSGRSGGSDSSSTSRRAGARRPARLSAARSRSIAHAARETSVLLRGAIAGDDEGENAAAVPDPLARRGRPAARRGDRHLLGLRRRARPQRIDLHARGSRLDRRRLRGCALVSGRCALRATARRRADARLLMLDEVEASGDPDAYVSGLLDRGERIMGFGHRVYRAEDPRARVLRRTAHELGSTRVEVAEELERAAWLRCARGHPTACSRRTSSSGRPSCSRSRIPLDVPGMFGCARVRLVGAHRRAAGVVVDAVARA